MLPLNHLIFFLVSLFHLLFTEVLPQFLCLSHLGSRSSSQAVSNVPHCPCTQGSHKVYYCYNRIPLKTAHWRSVGVRHAEIDAVLFNLSFYLFK